MNHAQIINFQILLPEDESTLRKLLAPYQSHWRFYHNLDHVYWMIKDLITAKEGRITKAEYMAVLAHDSVLAYEHDDVVKSVEFLKSVVPNDPCLEEAEKIMLATDYTKTGFKPLGDECLDLIRALDLKILASSPFKYCLYSQCILKEAAFLKRSSIEVCYEGRLRFLNGLLRQLPLGYNDLDDSMIVFNVRNEIMFLETQSKK